MDIKGEEFLLYCAVADVALLTTLGNNKLIDSEYYKQLNWPWSNDNANTKIIKEVLKQADFGNPVMMIMQLFILLVMPKQLTSDYSAFCKNDFNNLFDELKKTVDSTYPYDKEKTDYYRHIRNSLSHSNYKFYNEGEISFVEFTDKAENNSYSFKAEILYTDVSKILDHLCGKMMEYLNRHGV